MLRNRRTGPGPELAGSGGLSRRSLLGAAVTSVVAGSTVAKLVQQVGIDAIDEHGGLGLIVAQHAYRTDHALLSNLRRQQRDGGVLEPFVMLGVSVPRQVGEGGLGDAWFRTRGAAGWSDWASVPFAPEEGPDVAVVDRFVSQPLWVGFGDAVEVDLPTGLLSGAQVHLIRETPVVVGHTSDLHPVFNSVAPQPEIRSRSTWGARAATKSPKYSKELKLLVVHHTTGNTTYSSSEAAAVLRAHQAYHMDTNGWPDIGYHFLVDRFGRCWEGCAGGITQLPEGIHALGHNPDTIGVSMVGDFDSDKGVVPPRVVTDAVADLAAWKLGIHDVDVSTKVRYDSPSTGRSGTYDRIVGHKDVRATACPGDYSYARLDEIRQKAFLRQGGFPDVPVDAYYAPAVGWLVLNGITTGVGNTGLFKPDDVVDRAQMATFLWRTMGSPAVDEPHGFPDVPAGVYYEPAVRWARATGVTDGVGTTGRYQPNLAVSRAQMAAFLWRMAGSQSVGTPHGFPDVPADSYYEAPVRWLKANEITTGVGTTGRYQPDDPVTRAQMAAFLYRLASREEAWAADAPLPPAARF